MRGWSQIMDAGAARVFTHVQDSMATRRKRPTKEGENAMSTVEPRVNMKLEVQIIPVSDVDRSKKFYDRVGWRLDEDVAPLDGLRIVQFTPPGSGTSVTFGEGLIAAEPGSAVG